MRRDGRLLGGFIFYNTNILNRYTTEHDAAGAAGRLREEVQGDSPHAAAEDRRRQRRGRSLPAGAAGADARPLCAGQQERAPVDTVQLRLSRGRQPGVQQTCVRPCRPNSMVDDMAIGVPATSWPRRSRPARQLALTIDIELPTHGFTNQGRTRRRLQRHRSSTATWCCRSSATTNAASSATDRDRKKYGLAPKERMRDRDDPAGLAEQLPRAGRRLDRLRSDRQHRRRPDRHRAGLPAARVDRGRPALLRLQDGQPDPRFLRVPVGALRREEGSLERRGHRGLLPARARVQPRPHDRRGQGVAGLLHDELRPLPAPAVPHPRVPALRRVRAVVPQHDPVLGGHRLHRARPRGRREGHRLPVLRHGARSRAPVVGTPGYRRQRAGRDDARPKRWRSTRR